MWTTSVDPAEVGGAPPAARLTSGSTALVLGISPDEGPGRGTVTILTHCGMVGWTYVAELEVLG